MKKILLFLLLLASQCGVMTAQEVNENEVGIEVLDAPPEFNGGLNALMQYLSLSIRYPQSAQRQGIQGRVIVQFIVDKTGKVSKVEIMKSLCHACDKEAVRVVKNMPRWKPGMKDGKPVNARYTLPINFVLPN